jgi:hypothetical protein
MRQWLRSRLTYANVISTLALFLVLAGGTTLAATGGNFVLGQPNSADQTTSLTRTGANAGKGLQVTNTSTGAGATALGLNVASGHPPFTVNSGTKVANLNADKLDGFDRSQLPAVHYGTSAQDALVNGVIVQWFDVGASFRTDGDADLDNTLRVYNTLSSGDIHVLFGVTETVIAPGNFAAFPAGPYAFIVRNPSGTRSWLVICGHETSTNNVRCEGVASQATP